MPRTKRPSKPTTSPKAKVRVTGRPHPIIPFIAGDNAAITLAGECAICGCTEADCRNCIARTGEPCHWLTPSLCSACEPVTVPDTRVPWRRLATVLKQGGGDAFPHEVEAMIDELLLLRGVHS